MKNSKLSFSIAFLLCQLVFSTTLFAGNFTDISKVGFFSAKQELKDMLSGRIPLSYERAIFIIENAYRDNKFEYDDFQAAISRHVRKVTKLYEANYDTEKKFKASLLESEEQKGEKYKRALLNFAIYSYITDTTFAFYSDINAINCHLPYQYSYSDPLGTIDWRNTQVINLLDRTQMQGNCFALVSLFKIFSDRLNTMANICTAPGHVYIRHADSNGIFYNVELATRSFPGTGTIETLTYTTKEATVNNIALRELDLKQSVALCLVYLAKGYEYKFGIKGDDFILQCSELALQYDSLNLNALLLKAEVLETRILSNNKIVKQLQTDKQFKEYEGLITHLYNLGYREMPLEMKNTIIAATRREERPIMTTNHTPHPFNHLGVKDDHYATLSWGMFDEIHEQKPLEQYQRTIFDTRKKKITKFVAIPSLSSNYNFDPVVFAWSIDPLTHKFPSESPYGAFGDNPILNIDVGGAYKYPADKAASYKKDYPTLTKYLASNIAKDVMRSPEIMAGLLKYSGGNLTESEVAKATKWKSGPTIMFRDNPGGMDGAQGHYDAQNNVIEISTGLAKQLESASDEDRQAALYGVFTTVTHETVHYGDYLDGARQSSDDPSGFGGEPGNAFYNDVFDSKSIDIDGQKMQVPQGHNSSNINEAKQMMQLDVDEGKSDVIPTLPSSTDKKSDSPKK